MASTILTNEEIEEYSTIFQKVGLKDVFLCAMELQKKHVHFNELLNKPTIHTKDKDKYTAASKALERIEGYIINLMINYCESERSDLDLKEFKYLATYALNKFSTPERLDKEYGPLRNTMSEKLKDEVKQIREDVEVIGKHRGNIRQLLAKLLIGIITFVPNVISLALTGKQRFFSIQTDSAEKTDNVL